MTKETACLALCALAAAALYANDEITRERFPDADSVLVDSFEHTEYAPDGTYKKTTDQKIKVLTEKGRREESEIGLRYSARYGASKIVYVGIIGTNGVERAVDFAATMKESTDNSSMRENIYDPMDRKVYCTVPGLKVGETIRYKTERTTFKSRIEGQWSEFSVLEWSAPFLRATVSIKSPKERPLKKIVVRHPLGNVTTTEKTLEDGSVLRTWTATNSPQAYPDPDMPPLYTQVQNLQVSTAESWEEISRWYWNLCLPHLSKANAAITNKVAEIVAGMPADDADARIRAVYKWVAQEIRYMGLTMEDTSPGYAPHDVDVTFENRYGVCRDKAALLATMLRIAGIEAFPVLIHAGVKKDPEVPQPYFNHAIVAAANPAYVPAEGQTDQTDCKYILMDPTDESSRDIMPAYLGDRSYLVARAEGETLRTSPVVPASDNALVVESDGVLSSDGSLLLEQRFAFNGVNDNAFRQTLLRKKPEDRRKAFENVLRYRFPGVELLRCEILPEDLRDTGSPLTAKLVSRIPECLLRGETCDELNPPLVTPTLGSANWLLSGKTSLESRRYPLSLNSTASAVETLRITLGDAVGAPLSLPEAKHIEGKYGYERTYEVKDGVLTVRRRASVDAVEFSPAEYAVLRDTVKEVERSGRERPLFSKEKFANANAHYLLDKSETDLQGDSSWTVTNTVVKKILTYDGKKSSSELTFYYNPVWENVEIVEAVVSNANGKVARLSDKEVNYMDCGWASSAPRYPASKQMIVNLPSVEIGSVITYVVARTVRNAPVPFYAKWYFDLYEPADEYTVRFGNEWTRTVRNPNRLKAEPMTPPGDFWRDHKIVSSNSFVKAAEKLRLAAHVEPLEDASVGSTVAEVRDWMAKHVRIAGPSLYELPIELQLTDPAVVLKEHYASRLDYARTLCALLRGAGYEADVVFSSANGGQEPNLRRRNMFEFPNVREFSIPLCRVREYSGGWLWGLLPFGREVKTIFVGIENEYTPIGASSYAGSNYFDPVTEMFDVVTHPSAYNTLTVSEMRMDVRANGAVDFDVKSTIYGPEVGAFRKKYEELLPDDRNRHYQELLGGVSQSATATGDLVTDTGAYPAAMSFSCYVPSFATVEDDVMTLVLPAFDTPVFPLTGLMREAPINVGSDVASRRAFVVTFPEGYTEVEHLPSGYAFRSPVDFNLAWYENKVASSVKDGRLVVEVVREKRTRVQTVLDKVYFATLKDWSRIGSSRANRTIVVRRKKK